MTSRGTQSGRTNLLTSVVLVIPLVVFYGVGVLFSAGAINGADFLTQSLLMLLGTRGYLIFQGLLVLGFVGLVLHLRRSQRFELNQFFPVVFESGIYALTMGTLIIFVMVDLLGIDPRLAAGVDPLEGKGVFDRMVMAVGAGVYEELAFRLLLLNGLVLLCEKVLDLRPGLALALSIIGSSLLFAGAHHVGPLGEPLRVGVFTYRAMAGLIFALLYQYRSFAIAVYTHAIYDVYVFLLH